MGGNPIPLAVIKQMSYLGCAGVELEKVSLNNFFDGGVIHVLGRWELEKNIK